MPHTEETPAHAEEQRHHHTVKIYIDRAEKTSPTPTTGSALYTLGSVPDGYTPRCAECLPRQPALLKIPYQSLRLRLAPMTSC